jgi:LysM repeat protein
MKHNDVPNVSYKLTPQNYENIFNVFQDGDGYYYYNLIKTVNFPTDLDATTYSEYTTQLNDTWALIAWNFYRNVKMWWIICAANQILNPVIQPAVGTKLKIINTVTARSVLNSLS